MLMELAYRLIVEDSPLVETIRKNSVVMLTPVLETDGRDRYVDTYYYRKQNPDKPPIPLIYWGKYVAHDNNRDGMAISLALSKNLMKTWLDFHPQVLHDLHESVPYLYISTGTGPYNAWLDPITIDEWHILAYNEINELTRRGVPGVWTHGFYDGWAPNYAFYAANGHNAIGRFYETFGGGGADTGIRSAGNTNREWFRPNPPFPRVRWSIRNNINLQQSALLLGLYNVASNKEKFLRNYYVKSRRSIEKAKAEGPAAYVLPAGPRPVLQRQLIAMLRRQGIEIRQLTKDAETSDGKFAKGSFVVRMDQPYSRMADMLLDKQFYSVNDPSPYDDTGWTLGPLFNVETVRCKDVKVLDAEMALIGDRPEVGSVTRMGPNDAVVIRNDADIAIAQLRYGLPQARFAFAKEEFSFKNKKWPAGSVVITGGGPDVLGRIAALGVDGYEVGPAPSVAAREASPAKIALIHTWSSTQDEGWWRLGFDSLRIPYRYTSLHEIRDVANLKAKYDVIILPPGSGGAQTWLNGIRGAAAIPWKPLPNFPNLGGPDTTEDIRGGIDLEGVIHLREFVKAGGLLVAAGSSAEVPINFGLVNGVSISQTTGLNAPGGVFRVENTGGSSPVTSGYPEKFAVYFDQSPVLSLGGGGGFGGGLFGRQAGGSRRGGSEENDVVQGRPPYEPKRVEGDSDQQGFGGQTGATPPKVLVRFAAETELLISGMLAGGSQLAGRAAVVDAKLGKGHILLFANNPMWRMQTPGSYPLLLNAAICWKNLD
jgi:hypothetical protein